MKNELLTESFLETFSMCKYVIDLRSFFYFTEVLDIGYKNESWVKLWV